MRFISLLCSAFLVRLCIWLAIGMRFASGEVGRIKHRHFADSLTDAIYTKDNECSSSWGVSLMFDLLRPGSEGATLEQLCDVLALCGSEQELLWTDTISNLTSAYDGSCSHPLQDGEVCEMELPTIRVANSVWIDDGSVLQPSYNGVVGSFLLQTDFESEQAGGIVNEWVNSSTFGLIDSVIPEGRIDFTLLAINSIYLKASWAAPFSESDTNTDTFHTSTSGELEAHFMHIVDYFPYSNKVLPGYQVIKIPYSLSALNMVIVLPAAKDLNPIDLNMLMPKLSLLESQRVALAIPKFRFGSEYKETLQTALKTLGLTAPFDPLQGFCGLFEGTCQALGLILQKTVIDLNERGTVAAAVTFGGVGKGQTPDQQPVLFMANHAFQFFLYDEDEDIVLFQGRVQAPGIPDDSTAQLQALHSEEDFWTSNFDVDPTVDTFSASVPFAHGRCWTVLLSVILALVWEY